ncbi:MAG: septal ring lytic transglycosylase RlpA family protein [Catalinimonas sp.]
MKASVFLAIPALFLAAACAPTTTDHEPEAYVQEGKASYYANSLQGRRTSDGGTYDKTEMTAAHKYLPLGTEIEVTNLRNDSTVTVTVTDRGPYHKQRILDVSRAAARSLDLLKKGTAPVRIEVIDPAPGYTLADSVATDRRDS